MLSLNKCESKPRATTTTTAQRFQTRIFNQYEQVGIDWHGGVGVGAGEQPKAASLLAPSGRRRHLHVSRRPHVDKSRFPPRTERAKKTSPCFPTPTSYPPPPDAYPPPGQAYAVPPQVGDPLKDGAVAVQPVSVETRSRGDGFWRGCGRIPSLGARDPHPRIPAHARFFTYPSSSAAFSIAPSGSTRRSTSRPTESPPYFQNPTRATIRKRGFPESDGGVRVSKERRR
ncbi:hypothetical protein BHE74_00008175 [Ensete ventricosum]|nr:hypothetical protein BHE74_00008175 [Ensete ventricosum]